MKKNMKVRLGRLFLELKFSHESDEGSVWFVEHCGVRTFGVVKRGRFFTNVWILNVIE